MCCGNLQDQLVEIAESSARGGLFLLTGNALSLVILAVGSMVVARLLGPADYGIYSLSLVVPSIFVSLMDLGVNPAITRFSARFRSENKNQFVASVLKWSLTFKVVAGLVASGGCFLFADTIATHVLRRPEIGGFIKLASVLVVFQTLYAALDSAFIGLDRMDGNAIIRNIEAIAKVAFSSVLLLLGLGVSGAVTGHITSYVISGLVGGLILARIYGGLGRPKGEFSGDMRSMISYGFPVYASTLLGILLVQYQSIVLAFFASNVEIGNFSIAVNLSSLITVIVFPLEVLFPAFSKVDPANDRQLKSVFQLSVKYTALVIIPATVIVTILSGDIVHTLYGRSYLLAPFFLQLYALMFLPSGFGSVVLGSMFSGIGRTRVVFQSSLINLLVFLPCSVVLAQAYQVPGLIIASLISGYLSLFYLVFTARAKLGLKQDLRGSLRLYLASCLSAVPVLLILSFTSFSELPNLVVNGVVFLATYLTLLPLLGAFDRADVENFRLMFGRGVVWPLVKPVLIYEAKLASVPLRRWKFRRIEVLAV